MDSRYLSARLLILIAVFVVSACSGAKVHDSGREGLLDRLARDSHGNSRPSKRTHETDNLTPSNEVTEARRAALKWGWPLKEVTVTSPFGRRGSDFHEGVDLRAKMGTPVYAVEEGVVTYADQRLRGYGRMVLIRHARGLSTVYAHNSKLFVRKGQTVKGGQKIALSGKTGHAKGPHLHFEIREGVLALNPIEVLPGKNRSLAHQMPVSSMASK